MHEYALAQAVVSATLATADVERMDRVLRIDVHVGQLQHISRETFDDALAKFLPTADPRLASTKVVVTIQLARFRCRPCGNRFTLEDAGRQDARTQEAIHFVPELAHAFLKCPGCESPDFDIESGRGVSIAHIEGERG